MRGVGSLDVNAIGKDVLPRDLSARCAKYTRRPRRVASERLLSNALLTVGLLVGSLSMANEESNVPHAYHTRAVRLQRRGLQVYRQNVFAHTNSPSGGIVKVSYRLEVPQFLRELPSLRNASPLPVHHTKSYQRRPCTIALEVPQFLRELPSLRNAPRGFNLFEAIIVLLG